MQAVTMQSEPDGKRRAQPVPQSGPQSGPRIGPRIGPQLAPHRRQRGAVLIVGLVMLTVMTMLVVSMLKTSVVDLKIGGVSQDAQVNFNNAEVGMMTFFSNNNGKFSNNCLTVGGAGLQCNNNLAPAAWPTVIGGTVGITANQVYCGDKPGFTGNQVGLAFQTVAFDVISQATSSLGNLTRLHTGIQQDLPPGACSSV